MREQSRNWRLKHPEVMLWNSAKRRAKRDGTPFSITKEDIPEIPEICPVALIPILVKKGISKGPTNHSATLDQIDPSKGYVKDNIRILSHKGNRWKSDMTLEDAERLVRYIKGEI